MSGTIEKVTTEQMKFVSGTIYKIDAKTDFAELWYRGSFVVENVFVRYQFSLFDRGPWAQGSGLGQVSALENPFANPQVPLAALLGAPHQGKVGDTHRQTYDVEAEIRLSCRVDPDKSEIEVDEVRLAKVTPRR
jgi:hypothetical protein